MFCLLNRPFIVKRLLFFCALLTAAFQLHAQVPAACGGGAIAAETCAEACISCDFNGYTGSTAGFQADNVPIFCSQIQNDQWIGFIANATTATFTVQPSNCVNGVQVALYGGCGENFIACNAGNMGNGNVATSIPANLVPGTNYYLLIDGFSGDQCDIAISVSPANAVSAPPVGAIGPISGPSLICPGASGTYTINTVSGAGTYTWTAPPGALINGQPSPLVFDAPNGRSVQITFGAQDGAVCVSANNTCFTGGTQCINVNVEPIAPTILPSEIICFENVPYTLPWGTNVSGSGTYSRTYMSYQGCDSMVQKTITVKQRIINNQAQRTICIGSFVTVCGIDYYQTQAIDQICPSYQGCDSTIRFQLTVLNPVADIISSGPISCTQPSVTLSSAPSAVGTIKRWENNSGTVLETNAEELVVTQPGTYRLISTLTANGVTCTQTDVIVVTGSILAPGVIASATGTLGCSGGGTATITATADVPNATFAWTGPGGFTSTLATASVTVPGTYTVIVRDITNGCTTTRTVTVNGNTTPPTATATGGIITCSAASVALSASTTATTATYTWSGPGGYTATGAMPATPATAAGNYIVTVTNSSNCTNTATAVVTLNNTPPPASASVTGMLSCPTPTVTLNATTSATTPTFSWSGPSFSSSSQNPPVSVAGTYTVTVTSGANGCTNTASVTVTGNNSQPNISSTGAALSCAVQSAVIMGASTAPGVTFSWTGPGGMSSALQNPTVNMVGLYTLTVTATNNCTASSTALVTGDFAPPNASATGGSISCGATASVLMGSSTSPGATFSWTGPGGFTSTQQNPSVTMLGNYVLTVRGPNGCTATATAVVNANNTPPTANATGGTLTCTTTSLPLSATSGTATATYSWSGPSGYSATGASPATPATTSGTYIVTVTDPSSSCTNTATAVVNLNNTVPSATATVVGMLSCPTPTVIVSAATTAGSPTFSWTGPNAFTSAAQNPSVGLAGTYIVTITGGANGCTSTASVVVVGNNALPNISSNGTALNCNVPSATITGASTTAGVTFGWTGPNGFVSTQPSPTVTAPGNYVLTVSATNGCTISSTATVTGNFVPPTGAAATGGMISCAATSITLMGSATSTGVTYSWAGPGAFTSAQQNPSVSTVGSYTLTVIGSNGCTATAITAVTPDVNLPNVTANGDTLNCTVTSITLNGASSTAGVTPSWTSPNGFTSNQFTPTVTAPGVYTLTVSAANGCSAVATATILLDTIAPGAVATAGTLTCTNPNFTLSGSATATNVKWSWAGPGGFISTQQNPTVTDAGIYALTTTSLSNGCASTSSAELLANQNAPTASATTGNLTCAVTSLTLNGSSTLPGTYEWSGPGTFTANTQDITISVLGDYTVTVTAANGCTDAETVTVTQNTGAPAALAQGDTITCTAPLVQISASSTTTGATFLWAGPLGFTSSSATPTVDTSGTYVVTVTGLNGCVNTATAVVAVNVAVPVLQLAASTTLTCIVTTVDIQATVNSPASPVQTLAWTGPAGFISSVEDPAVTAAGSYTLVVTAANGCSTQQQVTVDENVAPPNAVAQGDTLTCKIVALNLSGTSATSNVAFAWTGPAGFTSSQAGPSVAADGTYTLVVTASNGCSTSATATVSLDTIAPGATAASSNDLDCNELSTTLQGNSPIASVVYEWSGPGAFSSTDKSPTALAAGTYSVTVTSAANGCISVDTVAVIQDIALPNVSAAGDTIDCISGSASLTGNSTTAGAIYAWSGPNGFVSNLPNPTNATVPGDYVLTVTSLNACTASVTAVVSRDEQAPVVTLSTPGTLTCANDTLTLTATITSPTSGFTAVWSGPAGFTSTQPSIQVTVPGPYTYTVTNTANGCKAQPVATLSQDIQAPQGLTATGGLLNCTNPTIPLDASTTTTGVTYTWSGPGGFTSTEQKPEVSNPGIYTVVITSNATGCTAATTAEVTQDPTVPGITVTTDTITCKLPTVVLNAETSTPGVVFAWSGPGITPNNSAEEDPSVSLPGSYTIIATAVSGCTASFNILVIENKLAPSVTTQGDTLSCTLPTGTISALSATGISYSWSGPNAFASNVPNPVVTAVGAYRVTVTAANGCSTTATTTVAADASIPQLTVTGGTISCKVDSIKLIATANLPVTWVWSGPSGFTSTLPNPTATASGGYSVVATAANGCSTTGGTDVLANTDGPTVTLANPNQLDCTTTRVDLSAAVQTAGNYTFNWTTATGNIVTGANTPKPQVSAAGTYVLTVLNNVNGCVTTDSVAVGVDESVPSAATRQIRDVSCFGDTNGSVVIDSVVGGTAPFVYSIDNMPFSSTASFNGLPPGVHPIVIQDAKGCELEFNITIQEPEELVVSLGADTTIHLGQQIVLSLDNIVNVIDSSRLLQLTLTPASLFTLDSLGEIPPLTPTYSFRYKATVVDANGCKASDERAIIVDKARYVYIPNIFNPESTNEGLFMISGGEDVLRIKSFQVYDRWGQVVHEYFDFFPGDVNSAWNGKINGKTANPAVFVYYAEIEFIDRETVLYKGDVLLKR